MLFRSLRIAINALRRHQLRTALTTLSISVGIAAVMCIVALGEGSRWRMASGVPFSQYDVQKLPRAPAWCSGITQRIARRCSIRSMR